MTFDVIDTNITGDIVDSVGGFVYRAIDMVSSCFTTFLCDLTIPYLNMSLFDIIFMCLVAFVLFNFLIWALREGL